jgi:hypothetical protein
MVIERIGKSAPPGDVRALAQLLLDAVDSNAGISFLAGLTEAEAEAWWRSVLESSSPRAVILVARDADGIAGTVQMQPAWGWARVGEVPGFALNPDGSECDTVFFYKPLS